MRGGAACPAPAFALTACIFITLQCAWSPLYFRWHRSRYLKFYIFTFYLAECTTIFYLRVDPTTTLSLFFYKVQCFIPPVAGGPCYTYMSMCNGSTPRDASSIGLQLSGGVWGSITSSFLLTKIFDIEKHFSEMHCGIRASIIIRDNFKSNIGIHASNIVKKSFSNIPRAQIKLFETVNIEIGGRLFDV